MIVDVTDGKSKIVSVIFFLGSKVTKSFLVNYLAQIRSLNIHIYMKKSIQVSSTNEAK